VRTNERSRFHTTLGMGLVSLPLAAQTITQSYSFNNSALEAAKLTGSGVSINNVAATQIDPNTASTATFIQHSWASTVSVPNSQQARLDASVPSFYTLQSISFNYQATVINWVVLENENASAATASFDLTSTIRLYSSFTGSPGAPAGTLVDATANTLSISQSLAADVAGDGNPGALGGLHPVFNAGTGSGQWGGADAYVRAPSAAWSGTLPSDTLPTSGTRDPISRSVGNVFTVTSGSVFTTYQGVTAGTQPTTFSAQGNQGATSLSGINAIFRAFSLGQVSVTYTFIPEPGTWMAGFGSVALLGWYCCRRMKHQSAR
jgi:hypothetical protein